MDKKLARTNMSFGIPAFVFLFLAMGAAFLWAYLDLLNQTVAK